MFFDPGPVWESKDFLGKVKYAFPISDSSPHGLIYADVYAHGVKCKHFCKVFLYTVRVLQEEVDKSSSVVIFC